jgi:hypothetical protein
MSISFCRFFSFLLLSAILSAYASAADAPTVRSPQDSGVSSPQTPPQTYDQIVRLSFVQGDVRISRGKEAKHATGGDWGQATAGIPLESGFSLATGKGRAEIEFEDASTVYLGDETPHLEAHLVKDGIAPGKENNFKATGTPIGFNHHTQSFQFARQVMQAGKSTMVTEHFGGQNAAFAARSGGTWNGASGRFGGGNSGSGSFSHASNSGGGSHGGGGFSSGGGSHGGGGGGFSGGGGGGGSHGGGGSGASSGGGGGASGGGSHK